ncbi:hypothetical protein ACD591_04440 [Rufibacter glacialis]|uniref:Lipoprotein n=1 Tax=Rufibacter glacialis TaxID=1259555 RepID=A0A5M8QEZ4_9BACT|nr:hypothetical protein [Rufibacter glacialis]KAA6434605.1 hypothetical protein FOE74_10500 [Rufibacter glacialis]GGK70894.1 hypothetical protein GCM10011405_18900 [Rufibacter glacialis]
MIQKNLKTVLAAAVLFLATTAACTETSELEEVVLPVPVEETVDFPRVPLTRDTTITLKVLYRPENGCGRFSRADSVVTPQRMDLTIFAAYPLESQQAICADISKQVAFTFRYKTTTPGRHYFRFWQADNKYLVDSIEVK